MTGFTAWILRRLLGGIGPILAEIEAILIDPNTLENLIVLAKDVVAKLEGRSDLTNQQKHNQAVKDLEDKLATIGLDVATLFINLAIEISLAYVRAELGSTVSASGAKRRT